MSNREHVSAIKGGTEVWAAWRLLNRNASADLSGASLSDAELNRADLSRADLSKADLSRAKLSTANLFKANLSGANLIKADLSGANLSNADLSDADLSRADLSMADLSMADLSRAKLNYANLFKANLNVANLSDADLRDSDLSGAKLIDANLFEANLGGAHLGRADLSWAKLIETDLSGANISAADMSHAKLIDANLFEANLGGANLSTADLTRATLLDANLSGADLSWATLIDADLNGAFVGGNSFGNIDLSQTKGLENVRHQGPSTIGVDTLYLSGGKIPEIFLRGVGLPENFITYLPSLVRRAIEFYSCFVSYSHADKAFARRLHDGLQGRGIRCWLDEHQLLPGDKIYTEVDRGIRLWDKVLLCCSKDSLTSWWVDNEIKIAFDKEQQLWRERGKEVLSLIPLNLDEHLFSGEWKSGLATEVKARLAAQFIGWEHDNKLFEEQFERLVKALRTNSGGKEPPPSPRL